MKKVQAQPFIYRVISFTLVKTSSSKINRRERHLGAKQKEARAIGWGGEEDKGCCFVL